MEIAEETNYAGVIATSPSSVPLRLDLAGANLSGHSLTQRTETAICFSPWG